MDTCQTISDPERASPRSAFAGALALRAAYKLRRSGEGMAKTGQMRLSCVADAYMRIC